MKNMSLTNTNSKGQVVIPKKMRDHLGIKPEVPLSIVEAGDGIFISPIKEVITDSEAESSYLKLLEKTKGAWRDKDHRAKQRSEIELKASKQRKKLW